MLQTPASISIGDKPCHEENGTHDIDSTPESMDEPHKDNSTTMQKMEAAEYGSSQCG